MGAFDHARISYNPVAAGKTITDSKHIRVPHCLEYLR